MKNTPEIPNESGSATTPKPAVIEIVRGRASRIIRKTPVVGNPIITKSGNGLSVSYSDQDITPIVETIYDKALSPNPNLGRRISDNQSSEREAGTRFDDERFPTYKLTTAMKTALLSQMEARIKAKAYFKESATPLFSAVLNSLESDETVIWSLLQMEMTGGQPDLISAEEGKYLFADCSPNTPIMRRGLDFYEALIQANKFKVEIMNEDIYYMLQKAGVLDTTSSSWLYTPDELIQNGRANIGVRMGDAHFNISDVPAESTNIDRGWRGVLRVPQIA